MAFTKYIADVLSIGIGPAIVADGRPGHTAEASIFKIPITGPGTLAITPRPRGGDGLAVDVERLAAGGVDVLVSLLTPAEQQELGLEDEAALCAARGIEFVSVAVPDLGTPADARGFISAVQRLVSALQHGQSVAVHCRQSVGRSGLLATSIAIAVGMPLERALDVVSTARGVRVPETPAQSDWLRRNTERLAGVSGPPADRRDDPPDEHDLERPARPPVPR